MTLRRLLHGASPPIPVTPRMLRNLRTLSVATLLGLAGVTVAHAGDLSGYIQAGVAVRTDQGDVIFNRQLINGKYRHKVNRTLSFRVETDFYHDRPDFFDGSRFKARLREGYAKLRFKNADLRVGRVQINWGDIEGFILADQVSPFDLEYFILPEFDEIRLGVDGAFLDYYFTTEYKLQLLWIGQFAAADFAPRGSPFDPFRIDTIADTLPPPLTLERTANAEPPRTFENSEAGIRLSGNTRAADWQVGYLYSFDDIGFFNIREDPNDPLTFLATLTHERFHLFIANLVVPVKSVLVRVEAAFNKDRKFNVFPTTLGVPGAPPPPPGLAVTRDPFAVAGVFEFKPNLAWLQNGDMMFQVIHDRIFDPAPGLARSDDVVYLSARVNASYRNETIKPRLFTIANTKGADMWVQAHVDWEPIDHWRFSLEYDFFDGHPYRGFLPGSNDAGGIYGQFDRNDLFAISARYSF